MRHSRALTMSGIVSLILVLAALGVTIWLLGRDDSQALVQSLHLNIPLALLSFAVSCAGLLLVAVPIWRRILASYGVRESFAQDVRIYCYSALGLVLPGGIWSIVSRSALYESLGVNSILVAAASVVETFTAGIAAMGVYGLSVLLLPEISLWKRPEIGFAFSILVMILVYPPVFNRLSGWVLRRSKRGEALLRVNFRARELANWIMLEAVVVVVGGLSVFIFLNSFVAVPQFVVVPVIAAWAASLAAGNLFFWLPGTPLLRDGTMVLILTPSLPLSVTLLFVLLLRVWAIMSLLAVALGIWLIIDKPYRKLIR